MTAMECYNLGIEAGRTESGVSSDSSLIHSTSPFTLPVLTPDRH